jgi:hypothetical protein
VEEIRSIEVVQVDLQVCCLVGTVQNIKYIMQ